MRKAIALVLGLAVATLIGMGSTVAQTQPKAFSWERKTNQLLQPKSFDQLGRAQRALRRDLNPLKLGNNRVFGTNGEATAPQSSSDVARYGRLDSNRDGFISRGEYMSGRSRPARARTYGTARQHARQTRLNSRFRNADLNRDGRLSTAELQSVRNRRF